MTLTRRGSTVSCSIPITHNQSSMRRTASETQLYEDEVEADYKDYLFYSRVVNGILSQHDDPSLLKQETQQCLQNIVRARHDDNNIIINDNHNDPMEQPHQHYYYATSNNHSNGSILHQQHEQLQQQQRPHRMLRFTTQALSLAEGEAEEDEEEEGIFDLEL
ncbi:hypothetical protein IV203_030525 [Nitzschia inconspicua]|uniref:Uncharacterized protein n=1 Tax=Nitzschia inconspicua TaxID=303405 RepID=A0A9K3Q1B2_9STRA|nr:hypothetical protein IV203_030525 [Nitzschia inconspicua]